MSKQGTIIMPKFSPLEFVYREGTGLSGLGLVKAVYMGIGETPTYDVMFANADQDFDIWYTVEGELSTLKEEDVYAMLGELIRHPDLFGYFIIHLNDIARLSRYHIDETHSIQEIRKELKRKPVFA